MVNIKKRYDDGSVDADQGDKIVSVTNAILDKVLPILQETFNEYLLESRDSNLIFNVCLSVCGSIIGTVVNGIGSNRMQNDIATAVSFAMLSEFNCVCRNIAASRIEVTEHGARKSTDDKAH